MGEGAESLRLERAKSLAYWRRRLIVGVSLTVPLILLGYAPLLSSASAAHSAAIGWCDVRPGGGPASLPGRPVLSGAWERLKQGSSNMDTLIALGTSTAFGYSLARLLAGHAHDAHSFMDAGIILTLITLGKFLEVAVEGLGRRGDRAAARPRPEDGQGGPRGVRNSRSRWPRSSPAMSSGSGPARRCPSTAW